MHNQKTQFLYFHGYFYGGGTTFTAHLIHTIMKRNEIVISRIKESARSELKLRDFGYGLRYQNVAPDFLKNVHYPFVTLFTPDYSHILPVLNEGKRNYDDMVIVIHDYRNISKKILPHIRKWKIVTIRRTVQDYLHSKFDLQPVFLHHPFYPYPTITQDVRRFAVSISRISYEKNIDMILRANRLLNQDQAIRIYGTPRRWYIYFHLERQKLDFAKYYYGQFEKSFHRLSEILSKAKFFVDLSILKNDGGGTQYSTLEAIHNGCALILHRRWLDNSVVKSEYCDFREGHNCFAVDNEKELADLIKSDPDTDKIVNNAKKLMRRHINIDWSHLLHNID
jgi:glycosyltransferase involved in cell wall biosynthesis